MNIKYTLWNPNGNITALVETPVDIAVYSKTASLIMKKEPSCEQVGFIDSRSLRMAGGEFCGNASMCAASQFYRTDEIKTGKSAAYTFAVSGSDTQVSAKVEEANGKFDVTLEMPKHKRVFYKKLPLGNALVKLPVVELPGIMHIIIEDLSADERTLEACIKEWGDLLNSDAVGIMLLCEPEKTLKPLVYVKSSSTLFWEGSCASGTAATGVYLAEKNGIKTEICFKEPMASLTVIASPGKAAKLKGTVEIIKSENISI